MSESTFTAAAPVAATVLCLFTRAATVTAGLMLHYTERAVAAVPRPIASEVQEEEESLRAAQMI